MSWFELPAEPFKFRTVACQIAARLRGLKWYSTGVSRSIMAPKKSVGGHNLRSLKTPPPSSGAASPRTPASSLGSKRKSPRGSSLRKARRGKSSTTKKLVETFETAGDDDSDAGKKSPEETQREENVPDVQGESVPDDPLWVQLEADGNPLMKQLAAHLRASKAHEDAV